MTLRLSSRQQKRYAGVAGLGLYEERSKRVVDASIRRVCWEE